MTPDRWKRIQHLAANALELEYTLRQEYVFSAAGGDEVLVQDVLDVLEDSQESDIEILRTGAFVFTTKAFFNPTRGAISAGEVLCGRFDVRAFLDAGGMGEVYTAWDRELDCLVALKTIRSQGAGALNRFRNEVVRARQISHRNICRVYDLFQHRSDTGVIHFLTMEFLEGMNLAEYVENHGKLSSSRAADTLIQVADGLAAAHQAGFIHRDLKPGNVVVVERPTGTRAVITDFGLALATGDSAASDSIISRRSGTLAFMAPEQIKDGIVTTAADVFAFGVLAKSILAEEELRRRIPGVFLSWGALIAKCTAVDAASRPQDGAELRALLSGRASYWSRAGLVAAALVLAAALVALFRFPGTRGPELSVMDPVRMTQYAGLGTSGTISLDGKFMAYASDEAESGNLDIWLHDLTNGQTRRLTTDPAEELYAEFSPDNEWVVYRSERNGGGVYAVSTHGGPESLIAPYGHDPTFSPDGSAITYWTGEQGNLSVAGSQMFVQEFPAGTAQPLHAEFADARHPVWSPDGKQIAFLAVRESGSSPEANSDWWIANRDGRGQAVQTNLQARMRAQGLQLHKGIRWWKDYFVFSAVQGDTTNVWYARLQSDQRINAVARLTTGSDTQFVPSLSNDGKILYSTLLAQIATAKVDLTSPDSPPEIITSSAGNDTSPSVSPDARYLAFRRRISGIRNIWLKDLQTGSEMPLTNSPTETFQPSISPDGRTVAWSVADSATQAVFVTDIASRETTNLCWNCGGVQGWTPDGQSVIVATGLDGTVWTVDAKTGKRDILFESRRYKVDSVRFSPDGRWLAFVGRQGKDSAVFALAAADVRRNPDERMVSVSGSAWSDTPAWSEDSQTIVFRSNRDGQYCIWEVGKKVGLFTVNPSPSVVRHFHTYRSHLNSVSRIGFSIAIRQRQMYLTTADLRGTVWLARVLIQ